MSQAPVIGKPIQAIQNVLAPKLPPPVALPPAPSPNEPATQKAVEDASASQRANRGRASTILTSLDGLDSAPTSRRTLLGK